jgi:isoleucyl-tRNA synthetase
VLHRLAELDRLVRQSIDDYDFHGLFTALHNFCAVDLSAFYFDIRKDRLYCDAADDIQRRATRTVLDRTFDCLVRWLAPIICFTAEEAWLARYGDTPDRSVHLELFPDVPAAWHDPALGERFEALRKVRSVVTGALEVERAAKRSRSLCPSGCCRCSATSISPSCASPRPAPLRPAHHRRMRSPCPMLPTLVSS